MAAQKKKPAKKTTTKNSSPKKAGASSGSGSGKAPKKQPRSRDAVRHNPRIESIVFGAFALIFFFIVVIPGARVWEAIRSFFYGMLGVCVILLPILFLYLCVITALEKTIYHLKPKVFLCVGIILLAESAVYLFSSRQYTDTNYFFAMGYLYSDAAGAQSYFSSGGGLISGVLGYPLLFAFTKTPAICVVLVLLVALILIVCGISLRDIGRAAVTVGRGVSGVREKSGDRIRSRRRVRDDAFQDDDFQTQIDIPIEGCGKKPRRKGVNVDITIDDDSDASRAGASESSAAEDFMDVINMVNNDYSNEKPRNGGDGKKSTAGAKRKTAAEKTVENSNSQEHAYTYPPVELLKPAKNSREDGEAEMRDNARKLMTTLDSFGVRASITNISRGPSVTRYEIHPEPGVKISKITNLSDDIALNLAANGVRIEAPIPGKAAVGIEVPNKVVSTVSMRELIDSDEFEESKSKLTCVLGRDISGAIVTTDIAKMPHLLIAGTTGSGKSVCVNSLLISILYKASPDEVKLLLIDPKMVEFSKYKGIPHLLVPVVSDAKKAAGALNWAVSEMLNRYNLFADFDCKDIDSYNKLIDSNIEYMRDNPPAVDEDSEDGEPVQPVLEVNGLPVAKEKMPRVVIAIDELADLMMAAPGEVEDSIVRLAQMARAAGMHLVIATQRPTANVITGLIKSNVPSRIALKVGSNIDSRIILDAGGAEKLIGRGDMLYSPVGSPNLIRVQGCFATDEEIESVTRYVKKSYKAQYNAEIEEKIKRIAAEELSGEKSDSKNTYDGVEVDDKMEEAIKIIIEAGQASTSMLQRRLKVGYARAGRMIDDMEQLGIVGPYQGSKPREVIMTYSEWLERSNNRG